MRPSQRLVSAALIAGLPLLLSGATAALAQTQSAPPSPAQSPHPIQSPPIPGQNRGQANTPAPGPNAPQRPSPMANTAGTGYYWYWVAGVVVIVILAWVVPRFLRLAKGSKPRRKP